MRFNWKEIKNVGLFFVLFLFCITLIWFLPQSIQSWFTQSPGSVAHEFVQNLTDHRIDSALKKLSIPVDNREANEQKLRLLISHLDMLSHTIENIKILDEVINEDTASVQLEVQFSDGSKNILEIPMKKEKGIWKITLIDPFWNLITQDFNTKEFSF